MTVKNRPVRLLVVDDDRLILDSIGEFLRLERYDVRLADSFTTALDELDRDAVDLLLCDANLPGGSGFELLDTVRARFPRTVFIMMTGYGTIESAVEAIRMGAFDYLTKPIIDDDLRLCVERAVAQQTLLKENGELRSRLGDRFGMASLIGTDYRMQRIFDLLNAVSSTNVTVLIEGPSGTGKSLVARVIQQQSHRCHQPFIEVSCGALPESLLETELFGHVRGAFTGAVANKAGKFKAADRGTIFLDEISAASPALQVKLLRVLQTRQFEPVGSNRTDTVDVRVLLASNVSLEDEVRAGRFREDLFYRVNVVTIDMPTLAERTSDIPILARHFLARDTVEANRSVADIEPSALRALQQYGWPGNVRELENVIARAVLFCRGRTITIHDLPPKLLGDPERPGAAETLPRLPLKEALEGPEKRILEIALRRNQWNRQRTAQQLGINRTTLYKKMRRFGLGPEHAHHP